MNKYLTIPIDSKNHGTMNVLIDIEDESIFMSRKWYIYKSCGNFYAISNDRNHKNATSLHKLLFNPPIGFEVDHRNRNGLDNRRDNIRIVTRTQNSQNRKVHSNNQTGSRLAKISYSDPSMSSFSKSIFVPISL